MEITKQTFENECGICVINSLVKHFHNRDVKIEILNKVNISEQGISLSEFENICRRFGVEAEAYEMDFNELCVKAQNNFLTVLLNNHYVIVRRFFSIFEIYDSALGKYRISIDEFKKMYTGIALIVSKGTPAAKIESFPKKTHEWIDLKSFLGIFILQMLILVLSVFMARYVSFLLDWSIAPKNFRNGLIISFIFLLLGIQSLFLVALKSFYENKVSKSKSISLFELVTNNLYKKKKTFFSKVGNHQIYSIEALIMGVVRYSLIEIPGLITNVIFCVVSGVILGFINPTLLAGIAVVLFAVAVITFIDRKYKSVYLTKGLALHNNAYNSYAEIKKIFSREKLNTLNENFLHSSKLSNRANDFSSWTLFFFGAVELLFSIGISYLCCYQICQSGMSFSNFVYATSMNTIFIHCCLNTSHFWIKQNEFSIFANILEKIITVDNIENNGVIKIKKLDNIVYDGIQIKNGSIVKDKSFFDDLLQRTTSKSILINKLPIAEYEFNSLRSRIICVDMLSSLTVDLEKIKTMPKIFYETIGKFGINLSSTDEISNDDRLLVNYLFLLGQKNKIILIKNHFHFEKTEYKNYFRKNIFKYLKKKNFICLC